jgi:hypothetical protein
MIPLALATVSCVLTSALHIFACYRLRHMSSLMEKLHQILRVHGPLILIMT